MEQDQTPELEHTQEDKASAASHAPERLSTGRKIRFAVLMCIMALLAAFWVRTKTAERRREQQKGVDAEAALEELREGIRSIDPSRKDLRAHFDKLAALADKVRELDPDNASIDRLSVPLYYAGAGVYFAMKANPGYTAQDVQTAGGLDLAVEHFNKLDVREIAHEMDRTLFPKALAAVKPFGPSRDQFLRPEIHHDGKQFLRERAFLWAQAALATAGAKTEKEKALSLCRWLTLHVDAGDFADRPAVPYQVIRRGYGSEEQLAWTYAELARQSGVHCKVAALPSAASDGEPNYLVQVYPQDADPFLLCPYLGVAVVEPASGKLLSLDHLIERPDAYRSLLALADVASDRGKEDFLNVRLKTAEHPYAFFFRFLVFDYLLEDLSERPRLCFDFGTLDPGEQIDLWDIPVKVLAQAMTDDYLNQQDEENQLSSLLSPARIMHLQGLHGYAHTAYGARTVELRRSLVQSDVPEAAKLLKEASEALAFFAALNAYDGGATERARTLCQAYLDQYPTGRWLTPARVLLAETLSDKGEDAAAAAIWKKLPAARKLYGALRLKGLLPMARPARKAVGPPENPEPS